MINGQGSKNWPIKADRNVSVFIQFTDGKTLVLFLSYWNQRFFITDFEAVLKYIWVATLLGNCKKPIFMLINYKKHETLFILIINRQKII